MMRRGWEESIAPEKIMGGVEVALTRDRQVQGFAGVDRVLIMSELEAQFMIGIMVLRMTEPGVQNMQGTEGK